MAHTEEVMLWVANTLEPLGETWAPPEQGEHCLLSQNLLHLLLLIRIWFFTLKGVISFSSAFWIPQRNPRDRFLTSFFPLSFSSLYSVTDTLCYSSSQSYPGKWAQHLSLQWKTWAHIWEKQALNWVEGRNCLLWSVQARWQCVQSLTGSRFNPHCQARDFPTVLPFWLGLRTCNWELVSATGSPAPPLSMHAFTRPQVMVVPIRVTYKSPYVFLHVEVLQRQPSLGSTAQVCNLVQHTLFLVSDSSCPSTPPSRHISPFQDCIFPRVFVHFPSPWSSHSLLCSKGSLCGTAQPPPPPWRLNLAISPIPSDRLRTRRSGPPKT